VEEAPAGIDVEAITAWFAEHVPAARPPLRFAKIAGGRSNLTFQVTDTQGCRWALRRPPLHSVLASAHDVGREARIMAALAPTDVPVPVVAGTCADDSVNGAPFFVMDFVEGHILRDTPTAAGALRFRRRPARDRRAGRGGGGLVAIPRASTRTAVGLASSAAK
jgi:aminoglycoside phosphotransferase (APT) family kinase protein